MRSIQKDYPVAVHTEAAAKVKTADVVLFDEFYNIIKELDLTEGAAGEPPVLL